MSFNKVGIEIIWKGKGINEIGLNKKWKTLVKIDPRYFRPLEVPKLVGDLKAKNLKMETKI